MTQVFNPDGLGGIALMCEQYRNTGGGYFRKTLVKTLANLFRNPNMEVNPGF